MSSVTKIICPDCGQEISKSNFSKHQKRHKNNPDSFITLDYKITNEDLTCRFCSKECKNKNSLINHQRLCNANPQKQKSDITKLIPKRTALGSPIKTENEDRLCTHCNTYFSSSVIGGHVRCCSKLHKEARPVRLTDGTILDIDVEQLVEYRKSHNVCEICGKSVEEVVKYKGKTASKNLCIDHDHTNNTFRGLLCQPCNRQLGWYEKHKDSIDIYLNKS